MPAAASRSKAPAVVAKKGGGPKPTAAVAAKANKRKAAEPDEEQAPAAKRASTAVKKAANAAAQSKATSATAVVAKPAAKRAVANSSAKIVKKEEDKDIPATKRADKATEPAVERAQPPAPAASSRRKAEARPLPILGNAPQERLNVYMFGTGDNCELGLGTASNAQVVKRPRLNALLPADTVGVVAVAAGGMHSVALTQDNKIYTWGVNDQGALGRHTAWEGVLRDANDDDDMSESSESALNPYEATPTAIPQSEFPSDTIFVGIAAGDSCSFALTNTGLVYGWGTFRNNEGILGFSEKVKIQTRPVIVPGLKNIVKITCGSNHVLALDKDGNVFAWGSGQQNQLGRRIVERSRLVGLTPREFGLPKKKIVYIAAGAYNSFAIEENGTVWAWGLNNYGECGIPTGAGEDGGIVSRPTKVTSLADHKLTCIAAGEHHTLAITAEGLCLAWGRADASQTGLQMTELSQLPADHIIKDANGRIRILIQPTVVPGVPSCSFAAAGSDQSLAITRAGQAYSWGFSSSYQTGQGTTEDIESATLIDNTATRGKKLVMAGAGGQFSILAGIDGVSTLPNGTA